jgi:HlyD family secretion protein
VKRSTKITLAVVVILGGSLLALAWNWRARQRPPTSQPATATVERRDFAATVLATGAVKPQVGAEVKVGARLSGKLERLHANIGDRVEEGQLLAELEKDDLEAAVLQRQAEVAVAEAQIAEANARLKLAEQEHHRQSALVAQNITSQSELDAAARDLDVGKATLGLAQRRLEAARATLREAEVKRSYASLTAPIAGVIGSVSTQEGETVAAGFNAPTFVTIIDLKRLQVDAFVDEVDIGKVQPGQQALFTVDAFPDQEFAGEVTAIYPKAVIQDNVVNYDVVVGIRTPYDGLLRPDMTASVMILLETRRGVLAVPEQAVKRERGKTVVYVRADPVEARPVKVGWKDGSWVEVISGIEEGQTVLLEAPQENPTTKAADD